MPIKKIHLIAAARPNFMKIAPLYHALAAARDWAEPIIVHTGQHYDANMSEAFFVDLGLPAPDYNLEIGSGSHAEQTGGVMIAYERLCRLGGRSSRRDRGCTTSPCSRRRARAPRCAPSGVSPPPL